MTAESQELIQALSRIDTPTLCNAVEQLKVRNRISGFADLSLRCMNPQLGIMCGFAVTAQAVTMAAHPGNRERAVSRLIGICEALQALPGPGVVIIQETGPHADFATHCGDVMATLFQKFGGIGVISDAGVRDLDEVSSLGFHIFARGLVASHAHFEIVRVNVPVTVGGLPIASGDLLHGDLSGLIKVPEEGRDELPRLAAEVTEREAGLQDHIRSEGATLESIYERFTH